MLRTAHRDATRTVLGGESDACKCVRGEQSEHAIEEVVGEQVEPRLRAPLLAGAHGGRNASTRSPADQLRFSRARPPSLAFHVCNLWKHAAGDPRRQ